MEILLFAVLSIFLFYRLWTVLGTRTGNERQRDYRFTETENDDNIVVMPKRPVAETKLDTAILDHMMKIKDIDPAFSEENFLAGAKAAYKMIVQAFSENNKDRLKKLLSDHVYNSFVNAIDERIAHEYKLETTIVGFDAVNIDHVHMLDTVAQISVRFQSEQIVTTFDADGKIIDNPSKLSMPMNDVWTFERDLTSDDLVWRLIRTRSDG